MKNIVVLDAATMRGTLQRPSFPHRWIEHPQTAAAEAAARIKTAHIVIANKTPLCAAAVANAKNLELVAVAATGADQIDLDACRRAGAAVCNVRNYANRSVAEHVMALVFCLSRRILSHHCRTVAGEWAESAVFSPDMGSIATLQGAQIGILGAGALGKATAKLAAALGMSPVFWLRGEEDELPRLPLAELLSSSGIVSLHCPLSPATKNIINRETLALMKPGAFLINTARGGLVDSAALAGALREGRLGGAGIDVLPQEPPPANEPLLADSLPNLIITPHAAWASGSALKIFHRQLRDNIEKFYAGAPQNIIP
ncbi:MAG: NAD(P)-dependent oxidoreductase [Gammaproteobacteria bacterium]